MSIEGILTINYEIIGVENWLQKSQFGGVFRRFP
jgi:hypothetical protein